MECIDSGSIHNHHPVKILQNLIRYDTTNPPGLVADGIAYIKSLLDDVGIETQILSWDKDRPNLVARLPGSGRSAPLLLFGHIDVVSARNQTWRYPPFAGAVSEGFVWGRGALDMKGGIAMMVSALLQASEEDPPSGDVLFAVVCDEETGGKFGSGYLVEEHRQLFEGVRYAIGEFGGFSMRIDQRRFYPIMVAEKQHCWIKATLKGPGGHGAIPVRDGAMAKLAALLKAIDNKKLPVHITSAARWMFEGLAGSIGGIKGLILSQIMNPMLTNRILPLLGEKQRLFDPLLRNTVTPTILRGSDQINVIPDTVSVELDGRILPGFSAQDLVKELHGAFGEELDIEVLRFEPGPSDPDMGLFDTIAGILRQVDPEGIPIPMLLSAATDARYFSRLGIQTYGFIPMRLPEDLDFTSTIHGTDERIPIEALDFGATAIHHLIRKF
jgi:acetylornithine deacetylase/succinyl-diaminopimelate desuccinylase-like protein